MNQAQKDIVKNVIQNDASITGRLYDGLGGYCVIGGLLHRACGDTFTNFAAARTSGLDNAWLVKVLQDYYGLSEQECEQLQRHNDDCPETTVRRRRLCELVDSFPTTP